MNSLRWDDMKNAILSRERLILLPMGIQMLLITKKSFDKVLIGVAMSEDKRPIFDIETRVQMARVATKGIHGVEVEAFGGFQCIFHNKNIRTIIRGLCAVSDLNTSLMGYANASLWDEIETLYLMPSLNNAFISSSVVRSVLKTWEAM